MKRKEEIISDTPAKISNPYKTKKSKNNHKGTLKNLQHNFKRTYKYKTDLLKNHASKTNVFILLQKKTISDLRIANNKNNKAKTSTPFPKSIESNRKNRCYLI